MKKKNRPPVKRVYVTVESEAYERLRINIRRAGLPIDFFSDELNRVIVAVDAVVQRILDQRDQGEELDEGKLRELLKEAGLPDPRTEPPGQKQEK